MYPLNMTNTALGGYAVANTEAEHIALTGYGYTPPFVSAESSSAEQNDKAAVMAALDAAGVNYDKRLGVAKLTALLG
jgi:hypothetical protein